MTVDDSFRTAAHAAGGCDTAAGTTIGDNAYPLIRAVTAPRAMLGRIHPRAHANSESII